MFSVKPILETAPFACPNCQTPLAADGLRITGMRNLADLHCANCRGAFCGDLPAGQALFTPVLLDKTTGAVFGAESAKWFADWLREAYRNKTDEPLGLTVKKFSEAGKKIVVLNCLDVLYGHSLLKLLNAQFYLDHKPDYSLIVIVQPFLEWLIPEGVSEAWIVDLPLRDGTVWNDFLADQIDAQLDRFSEVYLSVAFSHPHSRDFDIERFSRVAPLPLENFADAETSPIITFIWRDDRRWETPENAPRLEKLKRGLGIAEKNPDQTAKLIELAERLRAKCPKLDFAVAGLGAGGDLPEWISDLRLTKLDAHAEKSWCARYAKSHIVIGVHGSNMLLPSAHAGAVIELLGDDRTGNYLQDILFRETDAREMLYRYRFVPLTTSPETLAQLALAVLRFDDFRRLMSPEFTRHQEGLEFSKWLMTKQTDEI